MGRRSVPEYETKVGVKAASLEDMAGLRHAQIWTDSTQTVWDPAAEAIAGYESLKALKQAEAQAAIEGANSAAVVRNLLLQQSEALEEYEIAYGRVQPDWPPSTTTWPSGAAGCSTSATRRSIASPATTATCSSPAYRIWRDVLTTQSAQAHRPGGPVRLPHRARRRVRAADALSRPGPDLPGAHGQRHSPLPRRSEGLGPGPRPAPKRHINYLRISITDRCNLRCAYCMSPEGISPIGHQAVLSYEEIVRIAEIAVSEGITKIRITGGEPLVRKGAVNLIESLSKIEGITDLSMTTNGILLGDYAQPLFDAGLKRVNVSMDSLNPDLFREITRGGDLSLVWKGIERATAVGLNPIKINVVAIQGFNEGEVADFARLTVDHDYHVRFIEFMPVGNGNVWQREKYLSCSSIKTLLEQEFYTGSGSLR